VRRCDLHPDHDEDKTRAVRRSFARSLLAAGLSVSALSLAPRAAHAQEAAPDDRPGEVPSRPEKRESVYKPPSSVRLPTIIGGLAFTAGFWGAGAGTAYLVPDAPSISYLNRPVIGPWQAIYHKSCNGSCGVGDYFATFWYIFDGLAQAGGLGIALQGLLVPTANYGPGGTPVPSQSRPAGPRRPVDDDGPAPTSPGPGSSPATPPPTGPLFYLPRPMPVGQGGFGVGMGGTF
jgi:hypothetical protein